MVARVETPKKSDRAGRVAGAPAVDVRMLGPLTISRDGVALALPASRKVRALIAYLALAPRAPGAQPSLRAAVGHPERSARRAALVPQQGQEHPRRARPAKGRDPRAIPSGSTSATATSTSIESARRCRPGIEKLDPRALSALSNLFVGEFLDGMEIDRSPQFNGWLIAQRRRFRACHVAVLEHLVAGARPSPKKSSAVWRNGSSSRRSTGARTRSC